MLPFLKVFREKDNEDNKDKTQMRKTTGRCLVASGCNKL